MVGQIALFITCLIPLTIVFWNKVRVRGKILGCFARKDKSVDFKLCMLKSSFVIYGERAFDVYPDYVRVTRFPNGWPGILQELVPCGLWDEEDAVQKDWVTLDPPKEGSLSLRSALEENWMKKLVEEAGRQEGVGAINWRKIIPIVLMVVGVGGLILVLVMRASIGG